VARPSGGKTPEGVRRTNAARSAAIRRIIEMFPNEWKELYAEEASSRGVVPRNGDPKHRIIQLEAQLALLRSTQTKDQEEYDVTTLNTQQGLSQGP
jgi:hypothetical protein